MRDPISVKIKGIPLTCKHCGTGKFTHRTSQLNTATLSFFDLDWLNASADVYVCASYGYLHWFLKGTLLPESAADYDPPDEPVPTDDTSAATECLGCGESIPPGTDTCAKCGWSYRK